MTDLIIKREPVPAVFAARPAADGPSDPLSQSVVLQYLRMFVRRKWLIAATVVVALLVGAIVTLLATPLYTATTRVEISREGSRIVEEDVQPETGAYDLEFYQTQYGILNSRALAERVARELRLTQNPEFFEMFGHADLAESIRSTGAVSERGQTLAAAAGILLDNLQVEPIRLSRLVDVAWTSPDPELSARVANAWVNSFIQYNLERRFEQTSYARRFLEERLDQLRRRLEESERQLVGFASSQAIINIPVGGPGADSGTQERSLVADQLAALNTELAEATGDRVRAESRLRQGGGITTEAATNPTVSSLRQRRAEVAAEHARLLSQFESAYPPVQALAAQMEQLDRSIAREEQRLQGAIDSTYRDSLRREQAITQEVENLKQAFLDQRRRSIQYNIYQRDVDTNRELYDGLLQRYKVIGVAGGVGNNNIAIVDTAEVPTSPSHPQPALNLLIALIVGLVSGIALALLREQIDETIGDPADLETRVGAPMLGAIPFTKDEEPIDALRDPKSPLLESYLSVFTSLSFSTDHGVPRTLAVSSTRPAEGKSTTALALAHAIGRNGSKVILIDGDMRSPSLNNDLDISNETGLSNYLSGTRAIPELIREIEGFPFAVMTSGPQPPNAAELLRGERLDTLLRDLAAIYDHVIIDSPPVMGLADAPLIASRTEGVIFVVEAQGTKARMVRLALARLRQARATILGAVLTKFEAKRAHYGYGYDYGFAYGQKQQDEAPA